jgi:hypothetical protein
MTIAKEFNIGDRVKLREYADIPTESRNQGMARCCGKVGTITDKLYSNCFDGYVYTIKFDDYDAPSKKLWSEDCFTHYIEPTITYHYEFDVLDNVVVARFYEVNGEEKTEIERGHGHIIHEGAKGIAQASAYALKKIYEKMNGGTLTNV